MMTSTAKLTGKHVLAIIVAFFLTIIAANAIFITLAVKSFPGEQEKKSYLQGLAFNDRIAERQAQAALGWRAEITGASLHDGVAEIDLSFVSATSAPIASLDVSGALLRPAVDGADHALAFEQIGPGRYRAIVDNVAQGAWRLEVVATGAQGEKFLLEKRLTLE
jgi:nitrogen fixation protein FixH